jgi:cytochrome c oxidase subunit 2
MSIPKASSPKSSRGKLVLLLAGLFVLVLTGCASNAPLDTLDPAGSKAEDIDNFFRPIFWLATVVFVLIQGTVIFLWWRFRVPKAAAGEDSFPGGYADEEFPEQVHGIFKLEIAWTVIPAIILLVIGIFSVSLLLELDDVEASDSVYTDMEIVVVGQQWWWEYQYHMDGDTTTPPDFVTANEIVIPIDEEVRIYTTSRDVIHSFWIPRLNGKKDSVPGRVHPWVLQSNEVGRFAGQCTEFCGLSHAYMRMYAVALSESDFGDWVVNQQADRTLLVEGDENFEGQEVFLNNCQRCHVVMGVTERDRDGDGEYELDNAAMYGELEQYRDLTDGTLSQGKHLEDGNLTSGAAPNLTHFATRSSYAGSYFELYADAEDLIAAGGYNDLPGSGHFRSVLEAWLRNAPGEKPNATAEQSRGMPNLNLEEQDIDLLADYLLSLD